MLCRQLDFLQHLLVTLDSLTVLYVCHSKRTAIQQKGEIVPKASLTDVKEFGTFTAMIYCLFSSRHGLKGLYL